MIAGRKMMMHLCTNSSTGYCYEGDSYKAVIDLEFGDRKSVRLISKVSNSWAKPPFY